MGFLSNIENSVENGLSNFGHAVASDFGTVEHDVANSFRVGEVLAKGAWDYTAAHPGEVAESLAIAAGVGIVSGALTPLLPALAVVGVCATLGAVGVAAMGIKTVDSFKQAWPDLEVVWDADHHSKAEVARAEKKVEDCTGSSMTDLALLPVTFIVGNAAGNYGTQAVLAATSSEVAGAAGATGAEAAIASDATAGCATTSNAIGADCADSLPSPSLWMKIENNPIYNFFSSPYAARSDFETLINGTTRFASTGAGASRHPE
jgi:hypothetical protein